MNIFTLGSSTELRAENFRLLRTAGVTYMSYYRKYPRDIVLESLIYFYL